MEEEKNKKVNGRPRKFNSVEELENKIDRYFNSITITKRRMQMVFDRLDLEGKEIFKEIPLLDNNGDEMTYIEYLEHPTILSMCKYLGTTRETLGDYEKLDGFSYTIKKAKGRIENYLENQLYRKEQVVGVIFNLKNNFGWKDKQEIDLTAKVEVLELKIPEEFKIE